MWRNRVVVLILTLTLTITYLTLFSSYSLQVLYYIVMTDCATASYYPYMLLFGVVWVSATCQTVHIHVKLPQVFTVLREYLRNVRSAKFHI